MDYIINLNKPEGITSHCAVEKVKSLLSMNRAGHTGTLDPAATGVLLVCCNRATRISEYLSGLDKEYIVTMRFGIRTDTMDREGNIIEKMDPSFVTESMIEGVIKEYTGTILQTPPMFSAIKHKGTPLYKFARKGISVEREKRSVHVNSIELIHLENPFLTMRITCSKGTYIRSLCSDIAESAGTCGHVFSLKRTKVGRYPIDHSVNFTELENIFHIPSFVEGGGLRGFYSIDDILSHLREIFLSPEETKRLLTGRTIKNGSLGTENLFRLKDDEGMLIGIGILSNEEVRLSKSFIHIHEYLKKNYQKSI